MRPQYHFRQSANGHDAWDVEKLVTLSKSLPTIEISLDDIAELDEEYWFHPPYRPTCRKLVEHFQLIQNVDLQYPILLCENGRVMDGMHRVCRAQADGQKTIKAKKFIKTPAALYRDIDINDFA